MIIEEKRIEPCSFEGKFCGHITLDKLAIVDTVKVTVLGEPMIPVSFDCYGHPNFTMEQEKIYQTELILI